MQEHQLVLQVMVILLLFQQLHQQVVVEDLILHQEQDLLEDLAEDQLVLVILLTQEIHLQQVHHKEIQVVILTP